MQVQTPPLTPRQTDPAHSPQQSAAATPPPSGLRQPVDKSMAALPHSAPQWLRRQARADADDAMPSAQAEDVPAGYAEPQASAPGDSAVAAVSALPAAVATGSSEGVDPATGPASATPGQSIGQGHSQTWEQSWQLSNLPNLPALPNWEPGWLLANAGVSTGAAGGGVATGAASAAATGATGAGLSTAAMLGLGAGAAGLAASLSNKSQSDDKTAPTLTISSNKSALIAGESATITFSFSEPVRDFDAATDVLATYGRLGPLQQIDAQTYTATFRAVDGISDVMATFEVAAASYTDLAGNPGQGARASGPALDTTGPTLLNVLGEASSDTVLIEFADDLQTPIDLASLLPAFSLSQAGQTLTLADIGTLSSANAVWGLELHLAAGSDLRSGGFSLAYDASALSHSAQLRSPEGNALAAFHLGWLADGPIRGARIYADRDGNGSPSANEDTGLTSNRYGLLALSPADASAPVIATGGLDTFTSQPNQMVLQAPAGAVVVNPLTTLVQALVHQDGMTVAAAASAVAQALNLTLSLPAGFDLTNFDPLQTSANEGLPVQIAAVQVASLVTLGADSAAQRLALTAALADAIANAGTAPIDLGDETFLSTLLAQVWPAGEDVSALANHVSTAVIIIGTAGDQNTLNVAQTWALDLYAPGQPSLALVLPPLPSAQGDDPYTRIFIDLPALDAMDGSAPAVGDTLHILIGADEARAVSLSLNSDDLDAGYVTARLYPTRYSYGESLGVWLQDRWGHQGAITDWKALDIYQSAQSFDNLVLEHLNSGILDFVPDQMQGLHEDLSQARQSLLAQHPGLIGMGYAIGNDLLSSIVLG